MSFANLGNLFVPEVQVRGASNSLKIPIMVSLSKMLSWLFKLCFLKTLKLLRQRFTVFSCELF